MRSVMMMRMMMRWWFYVINVVRMCNDGNRRMPIKTKENGTDEEDNE